MARKLKKSEEVDAENAKKNETSPSVVIDGDAEATADLDKIETETETLTNDDNGVQDNHLPKCGAALRAKRIEQDLTTLAVAKQLRLSNTQIDALEQDDFSVLPEPTIVKGFIRNYAKLLKTPAEPILAAYAELMPKREQYAFALGPDINMKITENGKAGSSRYLILTILLLLGLGSWFFYQNYIQKPDAVNPMPEMAEILPEELALQIPSSAQIELPTIESPEPVDGNVVQNDATESSSDVSASEKVVAVTEADVEPVEANKTPVTGKTRLEFSATQETWLSVVNAAGEEVYNKILYAGNRDVVDVMQPSEIVVGNAHGATLIVDGKPINLAPYTRINVARVTLE
jgi:cytoskeleton protein RodZ